MRLDPLASPELQRALAFARARETYPGIPGDLLLELCEAAWDRAAGEAADGQALDRFEKAMHLVARAYRGGGGRLSVAEVADQAIPVAALSRYVRPANTRAPPVEEDEPAPRRRPLSERLARIPMARPAPVGVSVAAGLFGFVAAAQAGALPAGPLSFTGIGDEGTSSNVRPEGDHAEQPLTHAGAPTTLGQPASRPASHGPGLNTFATVSGPDAAHRSGSAAETVASDRAAAPESSGDAVAAAPVAEQENGSPRVAAAPAPAASPVSAPAPAVSPANAPAVAPDVPAGDIEMDVPAEAPPTTGEAPDGDHHGQDHADGGDHGGAVHEVTDALTAPPVADDRRQQDPDADQQDPDADQQDDPGQGDAVTQDPTSPTNDAGVTPTAPPTVPPAPAPAAPAPGPATPLAAPAPGPAPAAPVAPAAPAPVAPAPPVAPAAPAPVAPVPPAAPAPAAPAPPAA